MNSWQNCRARLDIEEAILDISLVFDHLKLRSFDRRCRIIAQLSDGILSRLLLALTFFSLIALNNGQAIFNVDSALHRCNHLCALALSNAFSELDDRVQLDH